MSLSPKGISIQSMYRDYRDQVLIVNRQYQRKLVWTTEEKQKLIESILLNYPIPLILLAEKSEDKVDKVDVTDVYEVIDGMQRLNAIFSFIEHDFKVGEKCFDLNEFARARQANEEKVFSAFPDDVARYDARVCSDFLDYQLAVTIFPGEDEKRITDIFGRINAGGKQLSDQERRQAGVLSDFARLVRELSADLRGDVSKEKLPLSKMPEISIETQKRPDGYRLKADEIFWCQQGILRTGDLRDSHDEEIIIDICASVLGEGFVDGTRVFRDSLYNINSDNARDMQLKLNNYGSERLKKEVTLVFSALKSVIESNSSEVNHFRNVVYPKKNANAQKSPFFAVFMAFFDLIIKRGMYPDDPQKIMFNLMDLAGNIKVGQKQTKAQDRQKNVAKTIGLIQDHFVSKEVKQYRHGPEAYLDFENSIRRSGTETAGYEFKQGILRLDDKRTIDPRMPTKILETICAIANVRTETDGYLFIGIADKDQDALRIRELDRIEQIDIRGIHIVGVGREAKILKQSLDGYVKKISSYVRDSNLSEPLKTSVASSIDSINYKGLEVIRIRIPVQESLSFLNDEAFYRVNSSTEKATGPQIAILMREFMKHSSGKVQH